MKRIVAVISSTLLGAVLIGAGDCSGSPSINVNQNVCVTADGSGDCVAKSETPPDQPPSNVGQEGLNLYDAARATYDNAFAPLSLETAVNDSAASFDLWTTLINGETFPNPAENPDSAVYLSKDSLGNPRVDVRFGPDLQSRDSAQTELGDLLAMPPVDGVGKLSYGLRMRVAEYLRPLRNSDGWNLAALNTLPAMSVGVAATYAYDPMLLRDIRHRYLKGEIDMEEADVEAQALLAEWRASLSNALSTYVSGLATYVPPSFDPIPVQYVRLGIPDLLDLIASDEIGSVYATDETVVLQDAASVHYTHTVYDMAQHLSRLRFNNGIPGQGVTVGVLEPGFPRATRPMIPDDIIFDSSNTSRIVNNPASSDASDVQIDHADWVTFLIAGWHGPAARTPAPLPADAQAVREYWWRPMGVAYGASVLSMNAGGGTVPTHADMLRYSATISKTVSRPLAARPNIINCSFAVKPATDRALYTSTPYTTDNLIEWMLTVASELPPYPLVVAAAGNEEAAQRCSGDPNSAELDPYNRCPDYVDSTLPAGLVIGALDDRDRPKTQTGGGRSTISLAGTPAPDLWTLQAATWNTCDDTVMAEWNAIKNVPWNYWAEFPHLLASGSQMIVPSSFPDEDGDMIYEAHSGTSHSAAIASGGAAVVAAALKQSPAGITGYAPYSLHKLRALMLVGPRTSAPLLSPPQFHQDLDSSNRNCNSVIWDGNYRGALMAQSNDVGVWLNANQPSIAIPPPNRLRWDAREGAGVLNIADSLGTFASNVSAVGVDSRLVAPKDLSVVERDNLRKNGITTFGTGIRYETLPALWRLTTDNKTFWTEKRFARIRLAFSFDADPSVIEDDPVYLSLEELNERRELRNIRRQTGVSYWAQAVARCDGSSRLIATSISDANTWGVLDVSIDDLGVASAGRAFVEKCMVAAASSDPAKRPSIVVQGGLFLPGYRPAIGGQSARYGSTLQRRWVSALANNGVSTGSPITVEIGLAVKAYTGNNFVACERCDRYGLP